MKSLWVIIIPEYHENQNIEQIVALLNVKPPVFSICCVCKNKYKDAVAELDIENEHECFVHLWVQKEQGSKEE